MDEMKVHRPDSMGLSPFDLGRSTAKLSHLPVRALLGHSRERRIALSKSLASLTFGVAALEVALDDARYRAFEIVEASGA